MIEPSNLEDGFYWADVRNQRGIIEIVNGYYCPCGSEYFGRATKSALENININPNRLIEI